MNQLMRLGILIAGIGMMGNAAFAKEVMTVKDYLKAELSSFAKMSKESFVVSAGDKKELTNVAPNAQDDSFTFYYGKAGDQKVGRACTIVSQKGKEGPISLGVCFEPSGLVKSVTILAQQEERGKGIQEQSFLKQFSGKKVSDAFVVGKDVDGISGATWSSKAVSEAVRKSSFAFEKYVKSKL